MGSDPFENLDTPIQDSLHMSDSDSIVRDRNILILCALQAVLHFPLVEGTSSAVDDQFVF